MGTRVAEGSPPSLLPYSTAGIVCRKALFSITPFKYIDTMIKKYRGREAKFYMHKQGCLAL